MVDVRWLVLGLFVLAGLVCMSPASALAQEADTSGTAASSAPAENPYADDQEAVDAGKKLYESYNCYACHGRSGGGGMGPSLVDGTWKYGGDAATMFSTIKDGRPEGMPGFSGALSEDQIWKLVTFVQSLSEGSEGP